MKSIILCILLAFSIPTFAGFGGSRGGFSSSRSFNSSRSYSSPSRGSSSFGGNRSTPRAPIVRPSSPSRSFTTHSTVIHQSSGMGFWHGMMIGNMLSGHRTIGVGNGEVIVHDRSSVGWFLMWMLIILVCAGLLIIFFRKKD